MTTDGKNFRYKFKKLKINYPKLLQKLNILIFLKILFN